MDECSCFFSVGSWYYIICCYRHIGQSNLAAGGFEALLTGLSCRQIWWSRCTSRLYVTALRPKVWQQKNHILNPNSAMCRLNNSYLKFCHFILYSLLQESPGTLVFCNVMFQHDKYICIKCLSSIFQILRSFFLKTECISNSVGLPSTLIRHMHEPC